jgi:hypothetical protein
MAPMTAHKAATGSQMTSGKKHKEDSSVEYGAFRADHVVKTGPFFFRAAYWNGYDCTQVLGGL